MSYSLNPVHSSALLQWADQHLAEELYQSARNYHLGKGVQKDLVRSFQDYEKSANAGHALAKCMLAVCYFTGIGTDQNARKAYDLFTESANQGCARARCYLSIFYTQAIGADRNLPIAFQLLEQGAALGDVRAKSLLGFSYINGTTPVGQNIDYGFSLLQQAYQGGGAEGASCLGLAFEKGFGTQPDIRRAVELYEESAAIEDPLGLNCLALCYLEGKGVAKDMK